MPASTAMLVPRMGLRRPMVRGNFFLQQSPRDRGHGTPEERERLYRS